MAVNDKLEKVWTEKSWPVLRHSPTIRLEGIIIASFD